ncbi:MAG: class I SAM-dependent methyltransferase [Tissierellia bacterium]|nr:class I SAM-dependent methyltransferase [Tissierellia bacterium]
MKGLNYWNHNVAYYDLIKKKVSNRKKILDVGCGDGGLIKYLINPYNEIVGIDPSNDCIRKSINDVASDENIKYYCTSFENYYPINEVYDSIIFVASIHHMDMENSIKKAKDLLNKDGILIIIGLYKPSTLLDWTIELLRVIPCSISSFLHKNKPSEVIGIPTSYDFPQMSKVRSIIRKNLPGAKLRLGLYYRFILTWTK